ncbi:MAG: DUF1707 domain-containing protein [Spirochaetaceae bacterium]|nr:DUF1707 domain-containing protein [Spirochaetaceae bacterium]
MIDDRATVPAEPDDDGGKPTAYGVPKLRRQVLQKLADAFADDNLELAEYERRVRAAELATTIGELEAVVADFPGDGVREPRATGAVAAAGAAVTVMGDREMEVHEAGDVPSFVINVMGNTRIDLSAAPPGVYDLRICSVMGDVQVAVPPGSQVNRTLWSMMSDVKTRPSKAKRPAAARFNSHQVNLAGFSLMSDVIIREEQT